MSREALARKYRVCRSCENDILTTAEGLQVHAAVCEFEKRTGLTVVQRPDLSIEVIREERDPGAAIIV